MKNPFECIERINGIQLTGAIPFIVSDKNEYN